MAHSGYLWYLIALLQDATDVLFEGLGLSPVCLAGDNVVDGRILFQLGAGLHSLAINLKTSLNDVDLETNVIIRAKPKLRE